MSWEKYWSINDKNTLTHSALYVLRWPPLWNICVTNDHGYVLLVANTSRSFPHSWLITGFVTILTRRVPLVEQELLTLPECTPGLEWDSCYSIFSFICMFCRSLFVLFYFFCWPMGVPPRYFDQWEFLPGILLHARYIYSNFSSYPNLAINTATGNITRA